jgi:hypothetical protein
MNVNPLKVLILGYLNFSDFGYAVSRKLPDTFGRMGRLSREVNV